MGVIGKITAGGTTYPLASCMYGTCATAAGTAEKAVVLADYDISTPLTGMTIHVKFDNTNTASAPTLNINSKGAKTIKAYGTTAPGTSTDTGWKAGEVVSFTYDGTYWQMNDYIPNSGSVTSVGVSNGGGLSVSGSPVTSSGTITISHADTSSQASSSNSGRTYIQSVTLDTYGHVTGLSTATETVTNTDTKLQVAEATSATQYYPLIGTGTTAATRQYDTTGLKYKGTTGTTSAVGSAALELGNSTASGTAGNKQAQLIMYGKNAKKATITLAEPSADIALALPTSGGTIALTSQIPTVSYPVTSVNTKTGAVSLSASDVGALASSTTYVSTVSTTAGTHSAISNKSGAVSFNVPTKTSHLTNDSNFVTSSGVTSIATTSPISGGTITGTGTISHATSGVGDGVTTAGFYKFKYDTYGHVTGVSSVTASDITGLITIPVNTDYQLQVSEVGSSNTYYPIVGNGTTAQSREYDTTGWVYSATNGTTSAAGNATITLGNNKTATTTNNKQGKIVLYGSTAYAHTIQGAPTAARTITLPNATGTVALTSDIPTVPTITLNGSATTSPSFYAPTGAGTSGQYLKSSGSGAPTWANFPTIPSVTLNGSASTSPSFYAPTGAGTSGQYLKSSGSGAPTWTNFPTIPSITLNGSSSTSPSFYAPTGAGTSGQYLKSSGSGAPTWTNFPTIPSITLNGSATTSPSFYAPTSAGTSGYYLKSSGSGAPTWTAFPTIPTMPTYTVSDETLTIG